LYRRKQLLRATAWFSQQTAYNLAEAILPSVCHLKIAYLGLPFLGIENTLAKSWFWADLGLPPDLFTDLT
jgi:hypothetical protein